MKIPDGYRKREIGETVRKGDMLYFKGDRNLTTTAAATWNKTTIGTGRWKENYGVTWLCLEPITMKNPDTHPNEFRRVAEGETVLRSAIYKRAITRTWEPAKASVGNQRTRTLRGEEFYHPVTEPVPVSRDPKQYNPDTHPQDFHAVAEGEVVSPNAVYNDSLYGWTRVSRSAGQVSTHTFYRPTQIFNPNSIDSPPPEKPKTESKNTMLVRTTIMHTPKVVPGQPTASEEILIGNTEVSATDGQVALLLLGAENATEIRKAAKTSTLRIIQSAH